MCVLIKTYIEALVYQAFSNMTVILEWCKTITRWR